MGRPSHRVSPRRMAARVAEKIAQRLSGRCADPASTVLGATPLARRDDQPATGGSAPADTGSEGGGLIGGQNLPCFLPPPFPPPPSMAAPPGPHGSVVPSPWRRTIVWIMLGVTFTQRLLPEAHPPFAWFAMANLRARVMQRVPPGQATGSGHGSHHGERPRRVPRRFMSKLRFHDAPLSCPGCQAAHPQGSVSGGTKSRFLPSGRAGVSMLTGFPVRRFEPMVTDVMGNRIAS